MNNLKKKILSFALATSVVLSSTSMAFAGSLSKQDKLDTLTDLGIITGEGNGVVGTQTMTRYRAFVMQLKMMGKYEEMNNFAWEGKTTFKDVNGSHSQFIRKLAAYLKAHPEIGIAGDHLGNLNPMGTVSAREYMKMMLVRLGYVENVDFTWVSIPLFAQSKGLIESVSEVEASNIQVLQIADFTYEALLSKPVGSDKTLAENLGLNVASLELNLDKVEGITEKETIIISGSLNTAATITVNGKQATIKDNKFSAEVSLELGENTIKVVAVDAKGIKVEKTVKVLREYKDLKVLKVIGHNLKQFTIQFSKELDKDTVTNARLGLGAEDIFEISKDGKSVLVTLDTALRQTTDTKYTIKDIKDTKGNKIEKTSITVNVFDNELPEVEDLTVKGNQSITITFSEPVKNADTLASYKVDDALVRGSIEANSKNTVFTITFRNALKDGDHTLSISSDIEDAAGFNLKAVEMDFTVEKDEDAPEAEIISATQNKVVIEFSEEIKGLAPSKVTWKSGSKTGNASEVTQDSDNNLRYAINFSNGNYLPLNGATLIVKNVEDFSGNVAKEIKLDVIPEIDLARPEVVNIETDDNSQNILYVTFDKDVNTNGVYTLIDKDNKEKAAADMRYADPTKKNRIKVTFSSVAAGDYTLEISGVTDLSALENELLPTLEEITINDLERVSIDSYNMVGTGEDMRILIKYSEEVDKATALNSNSYKYRIGGLFYNLPSDAEITLLSDRKTVEIKFPSEWSVNGNNYTLSDNYDDIIALQVQNVTDLAGNEIYTVALDLTTDGGLDLAAQAPVVEEVSVIGKNALELKLNHPINESTLDRRDFIIREKGNNQALSIFSIEYKDANDEYKLILHVREDLEQNGKFDAALLKLELAQSVSTENIYGTTLGLLGSVSHIDAIDKYAPEATVEKAVYGNKTEIVFEIGETVQFGFGGDVSLETTSETVNDVTTVTLAKGTAANDLLISRFTVKKGSKKLAIEKIQIVNGTKIVLVINDGNENWNGQKLDVTFNALDNTAYSITDTNGNILENLNMEVSVENIN